MNNVHQQKFLRCAFGIDQARDKILWTWDKQGKFSQRELTAADIARLEKLYQATQKLQTQIHLHELVTQFALT